LILEGVGSQSLETELGKQGEAGGEDGPGAEVNYGVEGRLGPNCGGIERVRVKASSSELEPNAVELSERRSMVLI